MPEVPSLVLALQGGGTHGAFTWGVLDRLSEEVEAGRLRISALSGASAGAINAAIFASGLASDGPAFARQALRQFWEDLSRRGFLSGNPFLGFADPGVLGFNIDWSPGAIFLEALGLVISPYNNPFYVDAMAPLLERALPDDLLERLNAPRAPRLFVSATNVGTNARAIFTQPILTRDVLRASAALPDEFKAVQIGNSLFWDGGYLGNPALTPLIDVGKDLLLVLVNPFNYDPKPPYTARQVLDRINQVTFNASVVLEVNAIEAVNRVLMSAGERVPKPAGGHYERVRFHLIRNDRFMEKLGFVSKSSTSWPLLEKLFERGRCATDHWLAAHADKVGREPSCDPRTELLSPMLQG